MNGINRIWKKLNIHNKILLFSGAIFLVILTTIFTATWVAKVFLIDLRTNLEANERIGNLIEALGEETELFSGYMKNSGVSEEELELAIGETRRATDELSDNFSSLGAERYALTMAIRRLYAGYDEHRADFLTWDESREGYLVELYDIYEMQSYIDEYARNLMTMTTEAGNKLYKKIFPRMIIYPLISIVISGIMIGGIIRLNRAMQHDLVEPVMELSAASKRIAENDYSGEDILTDSEDEIADLVHTFNKMKEVTAEYIEALEERRETLELLHQEEMRNIAIENQLEQTKFEALRNQMNPHFLFNTLNVIGGMANLEDADITEKMIKALSSLFRYNLRNEDTEIPLEQDLKIVEDYLYLQKMRFGERIKWQIQYADSIKHYLVPTFMFQPLVENAIVHGITPKVEGGRIVLSIEKEQSYGGEYLKIQVSDNGVGMSAEELREVQSRLVDTDAIHRGIGVGNIYRRLHLMYERTNFTIDSKEGEGTTITVEIPAREYEA